MINDKSDLFAKIKNQKSKIITPFVTARGGMPAARISLAQAPPTVNKKSFFVIILICYEDR